MSKEEIIRGPRSEREMLQGGGRPKRYDPVTGLPLPDKAPIEIFEGFKSERRLLGQRNAHPGGLKALIREGELRRDTKSSTD